MLRLLRGTCATSPPSYAAVVLTLYFGAKVIGALIYATVVVIAGMLLFAVVVAGVTVAGLVAGVRAAYGAVQPAE